MPIHDYRCRTCDAEFERLVLGSTVPSCPHCDGQDLERSISRIAPAGRIEALRTANRRAAAAEGHFSHYSAAERRRLLK